MRGRTNQHFSAGPFFTQKPPFQGGLRKCGLCIAETTAVKNDPLWTPTQKISPIEVIVGERQISNVRKTSLPKKKRRNDFCRNGGGLSVFNLKWIEKQVFFWAFLLISRVFRSHSFEHPFWRSGRRIGRVQWVIDHGWQGGHFYLESIRKTLCLRRLLWAQLMGRLISTVRFVVAVGAILRISTKKRGNWYLETHVVTTRPRATAQPTTATTTTTSNTNNTNNTNHTKNTRLK